MKKKNTGLEYEILVQSIFQEIHNQESAKNIEVRHNVKLTGKTGATHQIDVFWEFELGGVRYLTIVQVKDWNANSVKQEQILTFKSVLDDLPMQPRGIFVTKKGFQKGAEKFAKHHGIEMFELKAIPEPPPMKMVVGSYAKFKVNIEEQCFEIVAYPTKYNNIVLLLNSDWQRNKLKDTRLTKDIIFESLTGKEIWDQPLYNSSFQVIGTVGKEMMNVAELIREKANVKLENESEYYTELNHKFNSVTYLSTKIKYLPFIKLDGINFAIEITKDKLIKTPFIKPGITTFIFKNIIDGRERKFELRKAENS